MLTNETYQAYWQALNRQLQQRGRELDFVRSGTKQRPRKAREDNWQTLATTKVGGCRYTAVAPITQQLIEADFTIRPKDVDRARKIFEAIKQDKIRIERLVGSPLEWEDCSPPHKFRIYLPRCIDDLKDRSAWPEQHDWLLNHVNKMFLGIDPVLSRFRP